MAVARISRHWFHLLLLLSIFANSRSAAQQCVYTLYIGTGDITRAETESKITVTALDSLGNGIEIGDVKTWGIMGQNHKYFQRAKVDIFSNKAPCLETPICALNLTSDGSGPSHGWYCEYVDITTADVNKGCSHQRFEVEQWLARDATPYKLTTYRDNCNKKNQLGENSHGSTPALADEI